MRKLTVSMLMGAALVLAPMAGAAPDQDKNQKPAPAPQAPPKPEPAPQAPPRPQPEPPKPEPSRPEPAPQAPPRPEPTSQKPEPQRPEPAKPAPVAPQPPKPDAPKPQPTPPEPAKPEAPRPKPEQPQQYKPAPPRAEPTAPQPAKPEPPKPQPTNSTRPAPVSQQNNDQKPVGTTPSGLKPWNPHPPLLVPRPELPRPKAGKPQTTQPAPTKPEPVKRSVTATTADRPASTNDARRVVALRPAVAFDTVMVHQFNHKAGAPHKYTDIGTLTHAKPVVVPPIPPKKPTDWHHHHHHHPPFFSWAGIWDGIRVGFITIFSGGSSDGFCFGGYVTDPTTEECTPSPWYYYPNLPPYVEDSCLQDQPTTETDTITAVPHDWKPDLPHAMEDLTDAWQNRDKDAIARLLPTDGQVTVHVEGQDSYNLEAKDFADLFRDGILNTETTAYQIVETKQLADDRVQISAEHTFNDPWGQSRTIDHKYILVLEANGYVIREFRSSTYR